LYATNAGHGRSYYRRPTCTRYGEAMLRMEEWPLSPQSGRTTIAQRFIAGNSTRFCAQQSVKRTTEINSRTRRFGIYLSPVSRALIAILLLVPSTQVPGYFRHVR